jgi:quercetin dioxygenase-like cupin family protein
METLPLHALAEEHLTKARASAHGRSAHTVVGGRDAVLRHLLLALVAGEALADHEAPGEATLLVLRGRVSVTAGVDTWEGGPHDLVRIPPQRHNLVAVEDAVVVLTVAVDQPGH